MKSLLDDFLPQRAGPSKGDPHKPDHRFAGLVFDLGDQYAVRIVNDGASATRVRVPPNASAMWAFAETATVRLSINGVANAQSTIVVPAGVPLINYPIDGRFQTLSAFGAAASAINIRFLGRD